MKASEIIDDILHKYIILLADTDDTPINGKTKLQKIMFLLSNKLESVKVESDFYAHKYGPYSQIIEDESSYLEEIGLLSKDNNKITITRKGKEIAKEIKKYEDPDILAAISRYKEFLNDITTNELLTYVYCAHPDMAEESLVLKELQPNMEKHILALIRKEKISSGRAAELLQKTQNYIIERIDEVIKS